MVSDQFLSLLVCPMGRVPLRREGDSLICSQCGVRFAIKDNIPNMIVEEAELPEGCSCLAELECVKAGQAKVEIA
ncbi:Trm112 family protein [Tundrisphaera lichenicola]|uniref:Trm112 family protein n=1 Tax=Tundrisphaera lichenicola TaxID=2029860 RepID=UPI003EBAA538